MADTIAASSPQHKDATPTRLVDSRWFSLANLACALVAGGMWYVSDGALGPWPLLIAAIPWVIRVANGRLPVRRTRFDWLLVAFLVSAAVSAWLAYNQELSWAKFWLIVGALVLYYALAGQRAMNTWPIVIGVGLFASAVGLYFLLSHDWQTAPAKIDSLNELALSWMNLRPNWFTNLHQLHPNVAGGILALTFPLAVAGAIYALQKWPRAAILPVIGGGLILITSLILTTSRGAWLALIGGLLSWLLWIAAGSIGDRLYLSRRKALTLCLIVLAGIGLTVVMLSPDGLIGMLNRLPGPDSAGSRLSISREAIDLIGDFPVLGAGPGSFDGLYSQYIRDIPSHYLIHGHNVFLDVGVEQGVVGMVLLVATIGLAYWWLSDPSQSRPRRTFGHRSLLAGALFASFTVICLHGLVEDPLYGSRGVLLLWVPLGLTAILFPRRKRRTSDGDISLSPQLIIPLLGILAVIALSWLYRNNMLSLYESSRGAIEMARIELADYPTDNWSDGHEANELTTAETRFENAVVLNPDNRTAWHRLGLIAMLQRDYGAAVGYLREAYRLDPDHRGITKALAYSEIWSGQIADGVSLLAPLPEAESELDTYVWWWQEQGEETFSRRAEEALSMFTGMVPTQ